MLETFTAKQFDIILSDIGMPEMDGYTLMQQVRQLPMDRQTPAIALTAYAGEIDQQQAIAGGFQSHRAKPVDSAEVVTLVARLCGQNGETSA